MDITDYQCCVCKDLLYQPVSFSCGHTFCHEHTENISRCPMCRKELSKRLHVNTQFSHIITLNFPVETERRREECEKKENIRKKLKAYNASVRYTSLCQKITQFMKKYVISDIAEIHKHVTSDGAEVSQDEICYVCNKIKLRMSEKYVFTDLIVDRFSFPMIMSYIIRKRTSTELSVDQHWNLETTDHFNFLQADVQSEIFDIIVLREALTMKFSPAYSSSTFAKLLKENKQDVTNGKYEREDFIASFINRVTDLDVEFSYNLEGSALEEDETVTTTTSVNLPPNLVESIFTYLHQRDVERP